MAVLSWGKPKVEFAITPASGDPKDWEEMPEIKEDSAALDVTEGELIEATEEGGAVVDSRRKANKYKFSFDIYLKKGKTKPITDVNGVINENFAVRLTPQDPACEGFIMRKTNVTVSERWTAAEGMLVRYTFDGIKPSDDANAKICDSYIAPTT